MGKKPVVSVEPPWKEAWCEHVQILTASGYRIVAFHRWGNLKYVDEIYAPSGEKIYEFSDDPDPGLDRRLTEEDYDKLIQRFGGPHPYAENPW